MSEVIEGWKWSTGSALDTVMLDSNVEWFRSAPQSVRAIEFGSGAKIVRKKTKKVWQLSSSRLRPPPDSTWVSYPQWTHFFKRLLDDFQAIDRRDHYSCNIGSTEWLFQLNEVEI